MVWLTDLALFCCPIMFLPSVFATPPQAVQLVASWCRAMWTTSQLMSSLYVGERARFENENEERSDEYYNCLVASLRSSPVAQRAVIVLISNSLHQKQQPPDRLPSPEARNALHEARGEEAAG